MKSIFCFVVLLFTFSLPVAVIAQTDDKPAEITEAKTQVDINTADAATLALALDGIGMAKAQAIVAYREMNGDFETIDELVEVKGIGAATIARNRDKIKISAVEH